MRKDFIYFNGGWFSMLLSYPIRDLIHIHINNIFIDFIVGFIIFFIFYELGQLICSKVAKACCKSEIERTEYYIESIEILNKCIEYWKNKADDYENILETKYGVKDELFKKIAELEMWKLEWKEQVQKAIDEGWERTKLTGKVKELEEKLNQLKDIHSEVVELHLHDEKYIKALETQINKGNEWHYIKNGDYPKEGTECLCQLHNIESKPFGKDSFRAVLFFFNGKFTVDKRDTGAFDYIDTKLVDIWKEIVPPKENIK